MLDIRQSRQYADYLSHIGWLVEKIDDTNYFIKKLPVIGSVLKIQRPRDINFKVVSKLITKHRAFQIIIEPADGVQAKKILDAGYKQSNSPYLPTKTLLLNLGISKQKLLDSLKKDAKYAIKKADNNLINATNNLDFFRKSWKTATGCRRYVPPLSHLLSLKKSFQDDCRFLVSNDTSSGAIFLLCGKSAYYWQAFTGKEGRKNLSQYKIVWRGILWAKEAGAKIFDFEGIYDERFPNKDWLGFSHFKKSFGGHEISYPGTFIKTVLPFGL